MARARRISGSASASRLVAWSNSARLLRAVATSGWSRPEALLIDGEGAAHQRFGLGQPVGGLEQLRQVVEAGGDVRVVGPEALFVNLQGAAHQRFGLGVESGSNEEQSELTGREGDVAAPRDPAPGPTLETRRGSLSPWSCSSSTITQ